MSMKMNRAAQKKTTLAGNVGVVIIKAGDALNFPKQGDTISMHYIGYLEDGTMIDNSYTRGQPLYFVLGAGQVIEGWENVLNAGALSRGQKARITIPPELAYGEKGYPPVIPPYATLVYELELMSFSSLGKQQGK